MLCDVEVEIAWLGDLDTNDEVTSGGTIPRYMPRMPPGRAAEAPRREICNRT